MVLLVTSEWLTACGGGAQSNEAATAVKLGSSLQQSSVARLQSGSCEYYDEVRMQLPLTLERSAQLVFEIFHVGEAALTKSLTLVVPLFNSGDDKIFHDGG